MYLYHIGHVATKRDVDGKWKTEGGKQGCMHPIGQNIVTWPCLTARKPGNCSLWAFDDFLKRKTDAGELLENPSQNKISLKVTPH